MMQDWRCLFARSYHQGDTIRNHAVNSIPASHSELCRLGMDEEDNILQIFWTDLPLLQRDASSYQNIMGGANATSVVWLAPHYVLCDYYLGSRSDLVILLKLLCSLLHDSILLLCSFISEYCFGLHGIGVLSMYNHDNM